MGSDWKDWDNSTDIYSTPEVKAKESEEPGNDSDTCVGEVGATVGSADGSAVGSTDGCATLGAKSETSNCICNESRFGPSKSSCKIS